MKSKINPVSIAKIMAYLSTIVLMVLLYLRTDKVLDVYDGIVKCDYALYLCPNDSVLVTNYWGYSTKVHIDDLPAFLTEE